MHSAQHQQPLLIISNVPDRDTARHIAEALVAARAAACVNILPAIHSVYRWEGRVEESEEIAIMVKSTADRYHEVETTINRLHPYEVPEIIALPITQGLPAYLQWLAAETRKAADV